MLKKTFEELISNHSESIIYHTVDYLSFTNKATFNYIDVPYIIVPQNQIEMGLTLSISLFVMVQTLETAIFKLQTKMFYAW